MLRDLDRLRAAQDGAASPRRTRAKPRPPLVATPERVLTRRTAVWAVLRRPERQSDEKRSYRPGCAGKHPRRTAVVGLAEEFAALVRDRRAARLDPWLKAAQGGLVAPLRRALAGR